MHNQTGLSTTKSNLVCLGIITRPQARLHTDITLQMYNHSADESGQFTVRIRVVIKVSAECSGTAQSSEGREGDIGTDHGLAWNGMS